jgi:hypothetical protein
MTENRERPGVWSLVRDGLWLKVALGSFVNGNSYFGRQNQRIDWAQWSDKIKGLATRTDFPILVRMPRYSG